MQRLEMEEQLARIVEHVVERERGMHALRTLANRDDIRRGEASIPESLPSTGWGITKVTDHLLTSIGPAIAPGHAGPRYFGFVTGGVTPAATLGDILTTSYDANVQVHLPNDTITTTLESRTLEYILDLLSLPRHAFTGRTFTTGATASNILGLSCGRDYVMKKIRGEDFSVADEGLAGCKVMVFHADAHASIGKAAAVVGVGRRSCVNLAKEGGAEFDIAVLEQRLEECRRERVGCIVVTSHGEVNTGKYTSDMPGIRRLCDEYGAWLHVDAAFGAFAGQDTHLHLADSITSDAHKWLNVPYDCGIFFTRSLPLLQSIFSPTFNQTAGGPAYLFSASDTSIPSPLTIGIENSRRFRALPLYASLLSLGKEGYASLFDRNVGFAKRIAKWMDESGLFLVLNKGEVDGEVPINIVLFAAKKGRFCDEVKGGMELADAINVTGRMFVSATVWRGRSAVRIAVSNWRTGMGEGAEDDFAIVVKTLKEVVEG
ncbi:hypothetical protein HDU67_007716 [Dinochytrium kinnereticum]|nr:hypothetical protein HDU67_007716 [Dinochytrium kinnereticum]